MSNIQKLSQLSIILHFLADVKNCIEQKKRELYLIKRAGSSSKDVVSASLPFVKLPFVSLTKKTLSTKILSTA